MQMKVVILAAGDFPTHPIPLKALQEADFVVCCDSAYEAFRAPHPLPPPCREGMKDGGTEVKETCVAVPSLQGGVDVGRGGGTFVVIGDGDSLSEQDRTALGDRWIHVTEQDYNDLHKALAWATQKFSILNSHFSILGATGKREDHTLGNISYLVTFAEEYPGINLEMLTDHGRFCAVRGTHTFDSFPRQQVSLFAMNPDVPISGEGLQYPLNNLRVNRWWQATLNAALADRFTVCCDDWLVVFQTYDPKV